MYPESIIVKPKMTHSISTSLLTRTLVDFRRSLPRQDERNPAFPVFLQTRNRSRLAVASFTAKSFKESNFQNRMSEKTELRDIKGRSMINLARMLRPSKQPFKEEQELSKDSLSDCIDGRNCK